MKNTDKIIMTVGQLKKLLVKESYPSRWFKSYDDDRKRLQDITDKLDRVKQLCNEVESAENSGKSNIKDLYKAYSLSMFHLNNAVRDLFTDHMDSFYSD